MLQKAQQLGRAERTLRKLIKEVIPHTSGDARMYEHIKQLTNLGQLLQTKAQEELQDEESQITLSYAAGI